MSKRTMVLSAVLILAGAVAAAKADEPNTVPNDRPLVLAVKFHADWCAGCRTLGPRITDLANKYEGQPVAYVTLDTTTRGKARQARFLAQALGLDAVWQEHGAKTGFVLLIDARTRKVLARLTMQHDLKAMEQELTKAVEAAAAGLEGAIPDAGC